MNSGKPKPMLSQMHNSPNKHSVVNVIHRNIHDKNRLHQHPNGVYDVRLYVIKFPFIKDYYGKACMGLFCGCCGNPIELLDRYRNEINIHKKVGWNICMCDFNDSGTYGLSKYYERNNILFQVN